MAFVACSACASAQFTGYDVLERSLRGLQEQNLLPRPQQLNPLHPEGHPGLPPKTPTEPALRDQGSLPGTEDEGQPFKIIRSGRQRQRGNKIEISEGVEFVYRGYHVFADSAEGDLKTNIFTLSKNVQIIGSDTVIKGDRVTVDFERRTYRSYDAESQLSPKLVGGKLLDNVYIKGRESFGSERETRSFGADLTTCNLEHPHYDIEGEDVVVRPGIRAIFRKAKIRLFGRTILRLPFLSVPLDERTYDNLPVVGQSQDEGYYIKTNYGIPLKGESELRSRFDYMSKLGIGYGADYAYTAPRLQGFLRYYGISGQANTMNLSNQHQQQLGWGTLTLNTDIQKNNYLTAPESVILQNRALLTIPRGSATTRLGFTRASNQTQGFSTVNQSISLSDERSVFGKVRTAVDLNWLTNKQDYQSQPGQTREQLDFLFRAQEDLPKGLASLEYQRSIPIGDTKDFFSGSDRTPVVTFASDARKLMGEKFAQRLPFRTELSLGEFQDLSGNDHVSRGSFDFVFQKPDRSRNRFQADYNGQFRQGIYSDDTAQYVLNFGSQMRYRLGRDTSANLRYNYLRPYGFSPLQQDRTGRTNLVTTDVSYRPLRTFLVGAQTGYDVNRLETSDVAWQQLGIRTEWVPTNYFLFRTLSTYDTFQGTWSSVRLDLGYQPGATLLTIGTRYDGVRKVWSNVNVFLNNLKVGRAKLSAILAYNGYTKQFDSKQYTMIYDLHCAEAVLTVSEMNTGFRPGREIQFFIRLKAFPFDSLFGTGRRGQPIGTGTGRDF
jgi:LPS-assembly protein